ncbi:MAG: glycosyltransferase family 2 protein [Candidatus Dormibacteria bacterium]
MRVGVIIPTLDEAGSIADVIRRIPQDLDTIVVVADNGSTDGTPGIAAAAGARVVQVRRRGYGYACAAGAAAASTCDVLVFLDGDGSMAPEEIPRLLAPIATGEADLVGGVRPHRSGLMPWHQQAGNHVISLLLRRHQVDFAELCPFRAIRMVTFHRLRLPGSRFAWPAQMLARASQHGARLTTRPVSYSERTAGHSKVTGSLRGSLQASWDIGITLLREPRSPGS